MIKGAWKFLIAGVFMIVLVLQGCSVENKGDVVVIDDTAPAQPRGVHSITGDRQVSVEWYPNQETDLKGYIIYRSYLESKDYTKIATVGAQVSSYVDNDVENGVTYYYAISAVDYDGNESDLSPEIVDDTPRPAGKGITLRDYILEPNRCGFDLSRPEKGAQDYDEPSIDIYFGVGNVDGELSVPYIYAVSDDIGMQDLGYTDSMDDVDMSPTMGFTFATVEAIVGHTYAFLTLDNNYAKIRVTDVQIDWVGDDIVDAWITFDWAYQLQVNNPELAPPRSFTKSFKVSTTGGLKGGRS